MPAATDSNSVTACTSRLPWPHTITPIRFMLPLLRSSVLVSARPAAVGKRRPGPFHAAGR